MSGPLVDALEEMLGAKGAVDLFIETKLPFRSLGRDSKILWEAAVFLTLPFVNSISVILLPDGIGAHQSKAKPSALYAIGSRIVA